MAKGHNIPKAKDPLANAVVLVKYYLLTLTCSHPVSKYSWMNTMISVMLVSGNGARRDKQNKHLLNPIQVIDLRNGPMYGTPSNNIASKCVTF